MHGGFVGPGMLDAACPGEVFTSPVPEQMLAATKAVDGGAGVVHIVKNYTGDVMNFKLAAEDAADEGIEVESVLIDDDVAVQDSLYTAGRRGVGATVLAEKIAGAAAERGDDLAAVAGLARQVNEQGALVRRRAVLVHAARLGQADLRPPRGRDGGRASASTASRGASASRSGARREIAELMLEAVLSDLEPAERSDGPAVRERHGRHPAAGALPPLRRDRATAARARPASPSAGWSGSYITSLEMAGASLTLLELDDELTALWDAPVHTPALRWGA